MYSIFNSILLVVVEYAQEYVQGMASVRETSPSTRRASAPADDVGYGYGEKRRKGVPKQNGTTILPPTLVRGPGSPPWRRGVKQIKGAALRRQILYPNIILSYLLYLKAHIYCT